MKEMPGAEDYRLLKIPPFREAHMHFMEAGRPVAANDLASLGDAYVRKGIFSLTDMGHRSGNGLEAKKCLSGKIEVRSAGSAIFHKGGYGNFLGRGVSGVEEIKKAVNEIYASGADFIKVINSGVVSSERYGLVTEGRFSPEELKIIREEAGERNLKAACHANSPEAIRDAVGADVSSIEHGFFMTKEALHEMAAKKISWTPTASALKRASASLPPSGRATMERVLDEHLSAVNYAYSIGVDINIGSDSGSPGVIHGDSFFEEMRALHYAGVPLDHMVKTSCMRSEEIGKGNFVLVKAGVVSTGRIEAAYRRGIRIETVR
jgi:hypothetical protein